MNALSGELRWVGGRRRRLAISSGTGGMALAGETAGLEAPIEGSRADGSGKTGAPRRSVQK